MSNSQTQGSDTSAAAGRQIIVIFNTEDGQSIGVASLGVGDGVQVLLPSGVAVVSVAPAPEEMTAHMVRWTAVSTRLTNRVALRVRMERWGSKNAVVTTGNDLQQVVLAPLGSMTGLLPHTTTTTVRVPPAPAAPANEVAVPRAGVRDRADDWLAVVATVFRSDPQTATAAGGTMPASSARAAREPSASPPPRSGWQTDRPELGMTVADLFGQPDGVAMPRIQAGGAQEDKNTPGHATRSALPPMLDAEGVGSPRDPRRGSFLALADQAFRSRRVATPLIPGTADSVWARDTLAGLLPLTLGRNTTTGPNAR